MNYYRRVEWNGRARKKWYKKLNWVWELFIKISFVCFWSWNEKEKHRSRKNYYWNWICIHFHKSVCLSLMMIFSSTRHQLWKAFDVKMRCAHLNYRRRKRHHQPVCVSALGRLRKFNIFSLSSRLVSLDLNWILNFHILSIRALKWENIFPKTPEFVHIVLQ